MPRIKTLASAGNRLQLVPRKGMTLSFPLTPGPTANAAFNMVATGFEIELWLYVYAYANPSGPYVNSESNQFLVLARAPAASTTYTFYWRLLVAGGLGYLNFFSYSGGEVFTSATGIPPETWAHVRLGYNSTTLEVRFWVNNQPSGSVSLATPIFDTNNFSLGHIDSARASGNLFGQMDEFRWWRSPQNDIDRASTWRQRNINVPGITAASMACCYGFEDIIQSNTAEFADGSGNGLTMRESNNSGAGTQRGSTAPLLGGSTSANKLLLI